MTRSSAHTPVYWTLISAVMVLIAVILVAVWLLFDMMSYPAIMAHASEDAVRVTAIKNEIFKRFFEIFVTIASLLAGLSAILGIGTYALLKGRVERTIETQIEERVRVAQARTLSVAFNEFSFSWFVRYEPLLQRHLSKHDSLRTDEERDCIAAIENALRLASQGDVVFTDLDETDQALFLSTVRGLRGRVHILNQILYGETAKMVLLDEKVSPEYLGELLDIASALFDLGVNKTLAEDAYDWWEALETVGFARIWIGRINDDKALQQSGKNLLLGMIKGKMPKRYLRPLPREIKDQIFLEYAENGVSLEQ